LVAIIIATAWFGTNIFLLASDYTDEAVSVLNFRISIVDIEVRAGDILVVSVNLENQYSRNIAVHGVLCSVYAVKTGVLLTAVIADYTSGSSKLVLPGYSEKVEEYTQKSRASLEQDMEVRADVRLTVDTLYHGTVTYTQSLTQRLNLQA
jgi:hypothetical protein